MVRKLLTAVFVGVVFGAATIAAHSFAVGATSSPSEDAHPRVVKDMMLVDSLLTNNEAIVTVSSITPLPSTAEGDPALVQVDQVVWQSNIPFPSDEWTPINNGALILAINNGSSVWTQAAGALTAGGEVALGFTSSGYPSSYSLNFAFYAGPGNPRLIDPLPQVYTPQLQAFVGKYENLFGPSYCNFYTPKCWMDFVYDWNVEVHAQPPSGESPLGPIQLSFERFAVEVLFPDPQFSWYQASPQNRNMHDAPPEVQATLTYSEVWVEVPDSWKAYTDGALCLRVSEGSNGCFHMNSLNSGHLVDLIGWAVVDEPMTIEARPIDVPDPAASPSPTAIEPVALEHPPTAFRSTTRSMIGSSWFRAASFAFGAWILRGTPAGAT